MYGSTFWLPDEYTKGLRTEQTNATVNEDGNWVGGTRSAIQVTQETVDQINEMGEEQREQILNSPYIINYMQQQQEQAQVDPATGSIDENTVLPGAENNPFVDQLIAALQQEGDTSTETGGTSTETEVNSTDNQTDEQATQSENQVAGNPNGNRKDQIIGLLGSAQEGAQSTLPSDTQQTPANTDELPNNSNSSEELAAAVLAASIELAGGGGGGGGGGRDPYGDDGSDNPYWTPLNPYSKISKWRKARERVYNNIEGLLTPTGKSPEYAMSKKQMTEEGLLS